MKTWLYDEDSGSVMCRARNVRAGFRSGYIHTGTHTDSVLIAVKNLLKERSLPNAARCTEEAMKTSYGSERSFEDEQRIREECGCQK